MLDVEYVRSPYKNQTPSSLQKKSSADLQESAPTVFLYITDSDISKHA